MTYNPPPYQPPQGPLGYSQPQPMPGGYPPDLLAPARRAAIMCWVLGGLGLLCGVCVTGVAFLAPLDSIEPQIRASVPPERLQALGNIDLIKFFRIVYGVTGIIAFLLSALLVGLGAFVRRGGKGAVVTTLVLLIAVELFCALVILVGLVQAVTGTPAALIGILIWLVIAAAVGATILWLVQALRAGGAAAQRMQAYYWQMQQQQAFQPQPGYGYGYGYAPPPPPTNAPQQQSPGPMPPPPSQGDRPPEPGSG